LNFQVSTSCGQYSPWGQGVGRRFNLPSLTLAPRGNLPARVEIRKFIFRNEESIFNGVLKDFEHY